jgi:hypothetical protein
LSSALYYKKQILRALLENIDSRTRLAEYGFKGGSLDQLKQIVRLLNVTKRDRVRLTIEKLYNGPVLETDAVMIRFDYISPVAEDEVRVEKCETCGEPIRFVMNRWVHNTAQSVSDPNWHVATPVAEG